MALSDYISGGNPFFGGIILLVLIIVFWLLFKHRKGILALTRQSNRDALGIFNLSHRESDHIEDEISRFNLSNSLFKEERKSTKSVKGLLSDIQSTQDFNPGRVDTMRTHFKAEKRNIGTQLRLTVRITRATQSDKTIARKVLSKVKPLMKKEKRVAKKIGDLAHELNRTGRTFPEVAQYVEHSVRINSFDEKLKALVNQDKDAIERVIPLVKKQKQNLDKQLKIVKDAVKALKKEPILDQLNFLTIQEATLEQLQLAYSTLVAQLKPLLASRQQIVYKVGTIEITILDLLSQQDRIGRSLVVKLQELLNSGAISKRTARRAA